MTYRTAASRTAATALAVIAAVGILTFVAPQTIGVLALAQILLPHMLLASLVVGGVIALALRARVMALALVAVALVGFLRFGSEWISLPAAMPAGMPVALVSWNLELGARAAGDVPGPLLEHDADVVALQELTPDAAAALEADVAIKARYPYRLLIPDRGVLGIGILSAYPILDREVFESPVGVVVTLDLGSGRRLRLVNAHPFPGRIGRLAGLGLPIDFDATERDAAVHRVRARIDALLSDDDPLVVAGDYNTAPTEPAYRRLSSGLHDVHVEVGVGPGWTWRPNRFESLGIGLLRIDLVLAGPGVGASSIEVDCGLPGDHCLVEAVVTVP